MTASRVMIEGSLSLAFLRVARYFSLLSLSGMMQYAVPESPARLKAFVGPAKIIPIRAAASLTLQNGVCLRPYRARSP